MLKKKRAVVAVCLGVIMLSASAFKISAKDNLIEKDASDPSTVTAVTDSADMTDMSAALFSYEKEDKNEYSVSNTNAGYIASFDGGSVENESLSSLLAKIEEDGALIRFEDVSCKEALSITRSVTLSGSLSIEGGNLNISADNILLCEFYFTGKNASIRIKDGVTVGESGKIESVGSPAVILDFLSRSRFVSENMQITSSSQGGTLTCKMGSAEILGGSVKNDFGSAIESYGSLWLSGSTEISGLNFDVITDRAVYLSARGEELLSDIRVMYKKSFLKGTVEPVFYTASESSESRVSLFDETGEKVPLKYFESNRYTEEKNTLCAYLPFYVKFFIDGELYLATDFLKEEILSAPNAPEREGYTFLGWYNDPSFSKLYSFGTRESGDISLYAGFKLAPPEFDISSLEFTYDGVSRQFTLERLFHPLFDIGSFSFVWYKNGEAISNSSPSIPITAVSDSGDYFCKLTFAYKGDFVSVTTPSVRVTVNKRTVEKPLIKSYEYSGEEIAPCFDTESLFKCETVFATNVGVYPVRLMLCDSENYKWSDTDSEDTITYFEIIRAENSFLQAPSCEDIYEGQAPRVKFKLRFGEGTVEYSADCSSWSANAPLTAGKYYFRVSAAPTENYTGIDSPILELNVLKEECTGIKIDRLPYKTEYIAFETLEASGMIVTAAYNSGRSEIVPNGEVGVLYKNGFCLEASDNSVLIEFKGMSAPIPVTVSLAEYDISGIVFENYEAVYNGLRHTPSVVCDVVGRDNIPLGIKISGGGIDVGTYEISVSFVSESVNYKIPEPMSATLTVKPLAVLVAYSSTEFVYDGEPKRPDAFAVGVEGLPIELTVVGAGTDAGTYTASVSVSNKNYTVINGNVEFKILKADFDISAIKWSAEIFTYNGEKHSVSVSGLPRGLTLVGYANSSFTDAGTYTAEIAVSYDEKNYNAPKKITHTWQILPADYDFSHFSFKNTEVVFDGECHYPEMIGIAPMGYDGSKVAYSFSEGARHVSEGKKAVTVTFLTSSKNYNTPSPVIAYVTVLPKPVSVEWQSGKLIYNGRAQAPTASCSECEITVKGAGVDAGEYSAFAVPVSSDYKIVNADFTFTIAKAENRWLTLPNISDIFVGEEPILNYEALFGSAEVFYYKNAELTEAAELPLSSGEYYAFASIPESKNYIALSSDAVGFSVIPILPIALKIDLTEPLVAMKELKDCNARVFFLNNNGTKTDISSEDYTVVYQSGDTLKASDSRLVILSGGLSLELDIAVEKGKVRLPNIAPLIYDGSVQMPDGLTSSLYSTDFKGVRDAGTYRISFFLSDSENYEFEGGVSEAEFTVLKAPITLKVNKNGSSYETVSGTVYGNDRLCEEYYERDGMIFVRINNPNYELSVIPREEKSAFIYVILILSVAIVILLSSLGFYIVLTRSEGRTLLYKLPPHSVNETKKIPSDKEKEIAKSSEELQLKTLLAVDEGYANDLISDSVAKSLIAEDEQVVETDGKRRYILNLDTISESFGAGETVNINDFKKKGIIPKDAKYVKILARGVIDKPIHILANSFSLSAVKMIALTGGSAKRVRSTKRKSV